MAIKIGGIDNPTQVIYNGTNCTEVWYKSSPNATPVFVWPDKGQFWVQFDHYFWTRGTNTYYQDCSIQYTMSDGRTANIYSQSNKPIFLLNDYKQGTPIYYRSYTTGSWDTLAPPSVTYKYYLDGEEDNVWRGEYTPDTGKKPFFQAVFKNKQSNPAQTNWSGPAEWYVTSNNTTDLLPNISKAKPIEIVTENSSSPIIEWRNPDSTYSQAKVSLNGNYPGTHITAYYYPTKPWGNISVYYDFKVSNLQGTLYLVFPSGIKQKVNSQTTHTMTHYFDGSFWYIDSADYGEYDIGISKVLCTKDSNNNNVIYVYVRED